jgi:predicted transposase/invertase (TIGR01784 family)
MENEKDKGSQPVGKVRSLHDEVVKDFLSENVVAKSFFKEYLPAEITKNLDFDTLKISKDTFVDQELSKHFSDLLYHIKLNNIAAFIYLLIEHKSKEDYFTGFQLLKYMVKIWELHLKQNKRVESLPVILPIVIYHGSKKWRIDANFISLFKVPGQ